MSVTENWKIKGFDALTIPELYLILKLRSEVFVVEQDCVYLDADGKDQTATHIFLNDKDNCNAYARILDSGNYYEDYVCIGRVVIHPDQRGNHLAYKLIAQSLKVCSEKFPLKPIKISAQKHLQHFYEKCGFRYQGEDYLEDGIPHCAMYHSVAEK